MSQIIFLHGASSSGKSTLAEAIRKRSQRPFLHISIDHLRDSGAWQPDRYKDWRAARPAFFDGFHRAVAGFAAAGNDLILEHILDTSGWHQDLQQLLADHTLLFVGLRTPLATVVQRETQRADRPKGSAAKDHATIHGGLTYDITLDGTAPADQNADLVLQQLNIPRGPSQFFVAKPKNSC